MMNRRKFIKNTAIVGGVGALLGLYAWQVEPFWLDFVKVRMPIKNLPKQLIGKTVMQISDIHVGNRFDRNYLIEAFQEAQKYNPDFVVYTGDFVSYESKEQFGQLQEVMQYTVKGKLGTVGVLGNHDYGHKWSQNNVANRITEILENSGVAILRNEERTVEGLNFMGIDDYWATNFHPEKVMSKFDENKANIVLCHNPDVVDLPVWNAYDSWVLSGHTHGGQVKPPFLPPLITPVKNKEYTAGQFDLSGGRTLYINRALGHLWQVRFNVRPEITVFELAAG
jgi:predicted MPP superfamily phosphohydrolase